MVIALVAAGAAALLLARYHHRTGVFWGEPKSPQKYSFDASKTTPSVPYSSLVPGVDDLYLRGLYSYEQRTPESLKHSLEYFTQATVKDPRFAPAYAGLSNTYNLMREYSVMSDAEAYPKALAAAQRAIALDPNLPEAHASIGFIKFFWLSDSATAEKEFQTSIKLDPSMALAHHWYGSMLTHQARYKEAMVQLDLAQRLQPTSVAILSSRALALGLSGHRAEATDQLQELLNESPGSASPHQTLVILSLVEPRDIPRWLDESRRVAEIRHETTLLQIQPVAEAAYRKGGEIAMWKAIAAYGRKLYPPPALQPYWAGTAYAAIGNFDAAFAILMPLAKQHDPIMHFLRMDPMLSQFRKDPLYLQLQAEVDKSPAASHSSSLK